ncbi:MAG: aminotransferase class I/II-fold pyridoxal phosphate-dependent enzyme [Sedimentisphaerales bacterium]|nr:aminotransferase class I/II-fold pyridoxal phosphate-dependent enzyme [Sedimentisphaerales bacterium]
MAALDAVNWSNGDFARRFERRLSEFLGCRFALLTTNATTALKLYLLARDVGPGDEVIIPALTFPSIAMAVMECGATPIICDVEANTGCMSARTFEAVLSKKTRVVIPTHLYCTLCDMPPIVDLAKRNNIDVVEDCAHSPGARRNNYSAGTFGNAGIFSFNQKKPLSCGEGGCLVTNQTEVYETARYLRDFDSPPTKSSVRIQRMGKISEFQAAVLIGQLDSLPKHLRAIEERAENLREHLNYMTDITLVPRLPGTDLQTFYNICFMVNENINVAFFRKALSAELGIPVSSSYVPLNQNQSLNCTRDRQFINYAVESKVPCCTAERIYRYRAVRFPGYYLNIDPTAVDDIDSAITKVLPHAKQTQMSEEDAHAYR